MGGSAIVTAPPERHPKPAEVPFIQPREMAQSTTTQYMCKYLSILMIFLVSHAFADSEGAVLLIDNIKPPGGTLYIAIYAAQTPDRSTGALGGWQDEPLIQLQNAVHNSRESIEIALSDGHYAARAYLDRNQNGQLDLDKSGKPAEPFAISRGRGRKKTSIRFNDAVFTIAPGQRQVPLTLHYPDKTDKQRLPATTGKEEPSKAP